MTGVRGWGPGASRAVLDDDLRRTWLTAVHAALRAAVPAGRVLGTDGEPGPGRNSYSVVVDVGGRRRRLLLHAGLRIVACSAAGPPTALPAFLPVPGSEVFHAAGFQVPAVGALEAPLPPEAVAVLDRDEQADVAYHRPERVGDVLFNWFD